MCTKPGNCSGSYSVLGNLIPKKLRFNGIPIDPEATMFCTVISGLTFTSISIFFKLIIICSILRSTSAKVLAPVHTTLPLLNINAEVLGSLIRNTKPGNCSGLYSVLGNVATIFSNGTSVSKLVLTTIFTISISFCPLTIVISSK